MSTQEELLLAIDCWTCCMVLLMAACFVFAVACIKD